MMNFSFSGWNDAVNAKRIELVFENRNKNYGAYPARIFYHQRLIKSFLFSVTGFFIVVLSPVFSEWMEDTAHDEIRPTKEIVVNLTEPPPLDETPPPPPPPPPILRETVKFTPPKVVDKPTEEEPPPQEKLSETTVSTITQEGEKQIELPPEPITDSDEGKIFTIVDEMPIFPGGEEKLFAFLRSNIKYPPVARENGVYGRVGVNFIVDRNGKISDVKILKGIGSGCDEEALRVIRLMPDWIPGKQNGRPVFVSFYLPVDFRLK